MTTLNAKISNLSVRRTVRRPSCNTHHEQSDRYARLIKSLTICALLFVLGISLSGCSDPIPPLNPLASGAKILAFGDSLTKGTGASVQTSYPAVLARLSRREVINAGVPGELSAAGLRRLPDVLATIQPQLIIICHGGNDMLRKKNLAAAADNIRQMIELAKQQNIDVVLIGVPKPGLLLGTAEFYAELAQSNDVPGELKIISSVLSKASLKSDPVHPNAHGYEQIAQAIYTLLGEAGAL